ncbi:MAG: glucosamine-6-phosphate deaminase [Ruminococcaceae bacterium]|nr:glucosamine-6-phosphate deaminase [Oscillospiraceae bacterium]
MKVIVTKNYEEMSALAAKEFAAVIQNKADCVLGLATGDTPIGMYRELVAMHEKNGLDFSKVSSVNLDEYYPITPDNDQSYRYFMNYHLFDHVNIDKANTNVPDGTAVDPDTFCRDYEAKIDALGGIDIQVLGIGRNGHIGFNEPDANGLIPDTHLTDLTANTIEANSRFFSSMDEVPKQALTMGIHSVFKARKIVILASGEGKADAVRAMLAGKITTTCPASLLCIHPDVTLICDEAAYSKV